MQRPKMIIVDDLESDIKLSDLRCKCVQANPVDEASKDSMGIVSCKFRPSSFDGNPHTKETLLFMDWYLKNFDEIIKDRKDRYENN